MEFYKMVMDPNRNPLQRLPKIVRFRFMLILAYMWSVIFALWAGMVWLAGPSILVHSLLLIGVFFTADIFRRAASNSLSDRDAIRHDRDGVIS